MKNIFFLLIVVVFLPVRAQTEPDTHLFYLHGRIIEVQGVQAVSEVYGPYEYERILDTMRTLATEVHADVRDESTDFQEFCRQVYGQIDSLVAAGYPRTESR